MTQVGGSLGAIVSGIRIGGDVHPDAVAELRTALLRHKVVFLRDQQHATDGDQLAFAHLEFETEHPVVRIHPETGEPALLLGHFVRSFTGLSSADFSELFPLLQRHITRLENTARWTWRDGDMAIWDNRATQHYAVADYDNLPRLLHRITIAGDIPVGVSGDTSVVARATPATTRRSPPE